ncbi:hypothetical protein G9G39_10590 [Cronobacter sp. EKM101R]|uniref:transcriptional antitermination N peptide n=1 Tax=unclassified Cronobacter TaxID=2649764 RepID=UPI0013EDBAD5|nr:MULTISPECIES: hypothetical protein [unclassified Cronobacter]ELQ6225152.1 hypothetical protein [Cronobacter turicensis]KAF6594589.1 hypothetical protein G9G39_10590 [Cronobacter sp. EKM101R]KAF6596897.1 hypothetical protein G9G38_12395 [Cronobacter sp. EKM102R]
MAEIHFGASVNADNARARRHQRRRLAAQEKEKMERIMDEIFGAIQPPLAYTAARQPVNRIDKATRLPTLREMRSQPPSVESQRKVRRTSGAITGRAHEKRQRFSQPLV